MVDKRISDLEATTTLEDTTVFHIRKTETNEDYKITKSNLVKQIGNSVVSGFNATSPLANRLLLTPSNSGSLDQYYDGMTIKFISPINSTDLVKIKIGTLSYIDFKTTFTNPITNAVENAVLKTGKFYEAIYSNNSFIQTNIDRQYTNEYLSVGEIIFDNTTQEYFTLYTLTSATSYYKTSYYEGMSIVFTSGIINNSVENMSNGKIYIDVDGLGERLLSDPDGDGVPFSLQPNETILGIYDGEKFIKNMFTMQEPELPVPVDPVNPPPGYGITVYVGPNEPEVSNRLLQTAYDRIIKDYGSDGGGRKVLIKFRDNYTGEGLINFHSFFLDSYITIEGNSNVIMKASNTPYWLNFKAVFWSVIDTGTCIFNFTGEWKVNFSLSASGFDNTQSFFIDGGNTNQNNSIVNINNAIITNINDGNQNYSFYEIKAPISAKLSILNSELINFGNICGAGRKRDIYFNNVTITNTITNTRSFTSLLDLYQCNGSIIDLKLNITKPSNYKYIIYVSLIPPNLTLEISDTNIEISEQVSDNGYIITYTYSREHLYQDNYGFLTMNNNSIKYSNNVINTKGTLYIGYLGSSSTTSNVFKVKLNGNNYKNQNSTSVPDIVIDKQSTLYLKSGTLGSTSAINGGSIVNV